MLSPCLEKENKTLWVLYSSFPLKTLLSATGTQQPAPPRLTNPSEPSPAQHDPSRASSGANTHRCPRPTHLFGQSVAPGSALMFRQAGKRRKELCERRPGRCCRGERGQSATEGWNKYREQKRPAGQGLTVSF